MSTRDIQAQIAEIYGAGVSPDLVSAVTDSLLDDVTAWQSRPLESSCAIVFFDALRDEPEAQRVTGDLHGLDAEESAVFLALRDRHHGESVRLEQERIGQAYANAAIAERIVGAASASRDV